MSYTITLTEKEINAIKNGMFKYLIEGCDKDGEDYTEETKCKLEEALDNPNAYEDEDYDIISQLHNQNRDLESMFMKTEKSLKHTQQLLEERKKNTRDLVSRVAKYRDEKEAEIKSLKEEINKLKSKK